ncbi:MAG: 50S ribosomal protein L11 methyltransferase [Chitinophagales bacterium]|nr:50S ribosomal protein L11 methyltransferase [Chitinophagales bacterium]
MDYIQISIQATEVEQEHLIALLSELDVIGFEQTMSVISAFLSNSKWDEEKFKNMLAKHDLLDRISYETSEIKDQNWNKSWEADFHPVEIDNKLTIRASFHPAAQTPMEIIIDPQMAFGTGHHATTLQILKWLLHNDIAGKTMLDWGAGSGILTILASKLGCKDVIALENDQVALNALIDNVKTNDLSNVKAHLDESYIKSHPGFEIVLMNINKNTILKKFGVIPEVVLPKGKLVLSGFYTSDAYDIENAAVRAGFQLIDSSEDEDWACLTFQNK